MFIYLKMFIDIVISINVMNISCKFSS